MTLRCSKVKLFLMLKQRRRNIVVIIERTATERCQYGGVDLSARLFQKMYLHFSTLVSIKRLMASTWISLQSGASVKGRKKKSAAFFDKDTREIFVFDSIFFTIWIKNFKSLSLPCGFWSDLYARYYHAMQNMSNYLQVFALYWLVFAKYRLNHKSFNTNHI